MKNCKACGNIQETGNFCGKCGTSLSEMNERVQETAATEVAPNPRGGQSQQTYSPPPIVHTQPSVHVEKMKAQSKMYGAYFINYLKHPASVLSTGTREFVNGIISIALFAIIISLSVYSLLAGLIDVYLGDVSSLFSIEEVGPSFFSTFFSMLIIILVLIIISLFSMFIVVKVFGPGHSFSELVAFYGVHILPLIVISFVALILLLFKSFTFGSFLIALSLIVALSLIPYYLVSRMLAFQPKSVDPMYSYLMYIVLSVVLFTILTFVVADSTIGQIMSEVFEYTQYY